MRLGGHTDNKGNTLWRQCLGDLANYSPHQLSYRCLWFGTGVNSGCLQKQVSGKNISNRTEAPEGEITRSFSLKRGQTISIYGTYGHLFPFRDLLRIFGVLAYTQDLDVSGMDYCKFYSDKNFRQASLFEAIHGTVLVEVGNDKSECRINVWSYFLSPSLDEAVDQIPSLIVLRELCSSAAF